MEWTHLVAFNLTLMASMLVPGPALLYALRQSIAAGFVGGMLINLANPKSVLFSACVVVVIFPQGLSVVEIGVILANNFAIEAGGYLLFAALLATLPARSGYLKLKPVFERVAAAVLGLLGLRLLFSR